VTRATTLTAFHDVAAPVDVRSAVAAAPSERTRDIPPRFSIQIFSELGAVEAEWRQFERTADCTAFQSFDWLAAWQKHVGERRRARPIVAVGRFAEGDIAFIAPLLRDARASGAAALLAGSGSVRL
jgi:CelD/BcsL family acetyltransferase involved in cellulose biosynthesis